MQYWRLRSQTFIKSIHAQIIINFNRFSYYIYTENNRIQSDGCLGLLRLQKCQQYHRTVDYINMNIFVAA